MQNLNPVLKTFAENKCFIAINNFEGVNIEQTITFPVILRKFELALLQNKYYLRSNLKIETFSDLIWLPKELIHQVNGNFSIPMNPNLESEVITHKCLVSKYFTRLAPNRLDSNTGYFVG